MQVDLADWDATRETLEKLGHVDLLVNNAGVSRLDTFLNFKKEDLDLQVFSSNKLNLYVLFSVFN